MSIIRRMRPHEETISVGGTHVHTWVGGQGDPLLVLHGAGGNRGWRKWMERVAEHYTVWAPTHPGFGASGDAEWMEGIDDLARFYWRASICGGLTRHGSGGRTCLGSHSVAGQRRRWRR